MRWLDRLGMAVSMLFRRRTETTRLKDELQFHLDQQIQEKIAKGLAPGPARQEALRMFGNPTLLSEQARSSWSWNGLEKFINDLRYSVRALARSPGFAITAILVMALGIGATTALFTVVRAVLLKPLPFRDSSQLVMLYEHFTADTSGNDPFNWVAVGDFRDWRRQTHGFQNLGAWRFYGFDLAGEHGELPEVAEAVAGSADLFSVLQMPMALGRSFTPDEDKPGGNHVVVLTWNLFQRRFAADPSIVGKQIRLDTVPYQVVGVLPRWLTYPEPSVQLWVPYASIFTPLTYDLHESHSSHVVARLKTGVSADAATREVSALQYRLHLANASKPVADEAVWRPMIDDVVLRVKTPLVALLCAVGCMLLIACLNVSNLFVARTAARRKELAVRAALGGSRRTLIVEQMTESLLICAAGAGLGLLLSILATDWLVKQWNDLPRVEEIHVDGPVLVFSIGLVFVTAVLAGLLPAISSTQAGIFAALQECSRSFGGSLSRTTLRKALLTAEIALTVILLVASGLLFKSFLHLRTSDLGCATQSVLTMKYGLPEKQYDTQEKVVAFHEAVLQRVRRLPGVAAAGLVSTVPGRGYDGDNTFTLPDHPSATFQLQNSAIYRTADPGYFSTMKIPVIRGRVFSEQERLDHYHYVVVSKKFADQFFPGENPLGKRINVAWNVNRENYEIIGVVGDTLYNVAEPVAAMMYYPILSGLPDRASEATVVVRTIVNPLSLSNAVQQQVAALDPALPVYDVLTMQQILGRSTADQGFNAILVLAFAAISLLLAAIGLYGVLSYLVAQRVTEIGIRIALGAQRAEVLRLVMIDGLRPVAMGLLIGLAGAAAVAALIRSMLFGTGPLDPVVLMTMVAALLLTAFAACALPAMRASRIDPMQALRME